MYSKFAKFFKKVVNNHFKYIDVYRIHVSELVILMFLLNDQEYSHKVYLVNIECDLLNNEMLFFAWIFFVDKFLFSAISPFFAYKEATGKFSYPNNSNQSGNQKPLLNSIIHHCVCKVINLEGDDLAG